MTSDTPEKKGLTDTQKKVVSRLLIGCWVFFVLCSCCLVGGVLIDIIGVATYEKKYSFGGEMKTLKEWEEGLKDCHNSDPTDALLAYDAF
jgi:hypothetical protein